MVDVDEFIEEKIDEIASEVGDANAVIALSGGVDSSTAAALAYDAIGDQLTPVYVDTGLMRKGETDQIRETFSYMDSLQIIDAKDRFLDALEGVTDPEEKRHAIGEQFIREFETVAREVDADFLVQGTIYPDRIESEGTIKSHHNVGGLPERIDFDGIVEPMRDLYKDEVREVARELDLDEIVAELGRDRRRADAVPGAGTGCADSRRSHGGETRRRTRGQPRRRGGTRRTRAVAGAGRRDRQSDRRERRQPRPRLGRRRALGGIPRRDDSPRPGGRLGDTPAHPVTDHRRERERLACAVRRDAQTAGNDRVRVR